MPEDAPGDAPEEMVVASPRRGEAALAELLGPSVHPDVERLLVVARLGPAAPGEEPRYLFVRWPDWPYPALLSVEPPAATDTLEDVVGSLLRARLQVTLSSPVRLTSTRVPVRMALRRYGAAGTGWLRGAVVDVTGEPEADALLDGFEALTLDEALSGLPTDVERAVLREAAELG